jgi:MFS family permease
MASFPSSFYTLGCIGGAISPTLTGLFVQYTKTSWRGMTYLLAGVSGATLILQYLYVPDTSHEECRAVILRRETGKKWVWEWEAINFTRCLGMLKDKRILMIVSTRLPTVIYAVGGRH